MLASLDPTNVPPAPESRPEPAGLERGQPITHAKLVAALARHDFQPARAAKALGISRTTIYHHIRRDPTLGLVTRISESQLDKELKACDGDLHAVARRLKVSYRALQIRMNKA
jgi:two-component system nitrogen regulation response regulator GlnG